VTQKTATLYPVILPVPAAVRQLPPRERVRFLSRHARRAVVLSAQRQGLAGGALTFEKDPNGAPAPCGGRHWSLSHTLGYVGGVSAAQQIGLDIEGIRGGIDNLFRKVACENEWALAAGSDRIRTFFRFWTAKEAVLKASGDGIAGLSRCRIMAIPDDTHLLLEYASALWPVEQLFFAEHVAAVTTGGRPVEWAVMETG
jgi:4'-phosphopantetheinyl transferase